MAYDSQHIRFVRGYHPVGNHLLTGTILLTTHVEPRNIMKHRSRTMILWNSNYKTLDVPSGYSHSIYEGVGGKTYLPINGLLTSMDT
jgi:hypothetical protein